MCFSFVADNFKACAVECNRHTNKNTNKTLTTTRGQDLKEGLSKDVSF